MFVKRICRESRESISCDSGGNLSKVVNNGDGAAYTTYTGYNALGQPGNIAFKNGVNTQYTYYPANNLLHTIYTSSTTTTLLNLSYDDYDNVGNIRTITDNTPRTQQAPHFDEAAEYDYPANHVRPHAVQHNLITGTTYVYDNNGNMTANGTKTIDYNYDNMPTLISPNGSSSTSYIYNGRGERVVKIRSTATVYIGKYYQCTSGACEKFIFAGGTRIAHKMKGTDITTYYHPDHLGSTSAVSDQWGNKTEDMQYFPFGETRLQYGSDNMPHKYTSQELDTETGLYYYHARYYNPSLGRFISADTIVPNPCNPQAFNRYSYVLNNPLRYTDPSGHYSLDDLRKDGNRLEQDARHEGARAQETVQNIISSGNAALQSITPEFHGGMANGLAGGMNKMNNEIDRTFGSTNDFGQILKYTAAATVGTGIVATALMNPVTAGIIIGGLFMVDPAWTLSNTMVALNFSAPGLVVNFGVTEAGRGHGRLPSTTTFANRPVIDNSMFGNIGGLGGPGGFTPGPVAFYSPYLDQETKMHEIGHQLQYEDWGGQKMTEQLLFNRRNMEENADRRATDFFGVPVNLY